MSVRWEPVADAGQVDAPLGEVPPAPAPAAWRRWGWVVALVPTVALVVWTRLAPGQGWAEPRWVAVLLPLALALTAVLALVRYGDDRAVAADARGRAALAADPRSTTGTVVVRSTTAARRAVRVAGRVSWTADRETRTEPFTLVVPATPDAAPAAAGTTGLPRTGDPVAVWWSPDATLVVVRHHRGWADAVLRSLAPEVPDDASGTDGTADDRPDDQPDEATPRS